MLDCQNLDQNSILRQLDCKEQLCAMHMRQKVHLLSKF